MNVLITGASRGIGLELVKQFLQAGDTVWALSRQKKTGLANEAYEKGTLHWLQEEDLLSEDFLGRVAGWEFRLDIVIHNAGFLVNKAFADISPAELEQSYETNVYLPYRLTQVLLPRLSPKAHSIFISSVGGINGTQKFPGLTAYSSSKAAMACLAECLQAEFAETSWSFNSLALGAVQTEMLQQAFPGYEAPVSAEQMAGFIYRFAKNEGQMVKGKSILVSSSNP